MWVCLRLSIKSKFYQIKPNYEKSTFNLKTSGINNNFEISEKKYDYFYQK